MTNVSRVSAPYALWQQLVETYAAIAPDELAATLYLWANEATRYGFRYT